MNFLEFRIVREKSLLLRLDNDSHEHNDKSVIKIPDSLYSNLADIVDETIILGIRPKDITVLGADEEFDGLKLKGEITYIELLGDESIAEVKVGHDLLKISNITSRIDNLFVGSEGTLGIKYDKINLFTNSGERIYFKLI